MDTRTFPVLIYDPRKGDKIAQRLSLQGNPSEKTDFFIEPKTNEIYDFIRFARSRRRGRSQPRSHERSYRQRRQPKQNVDQSQTRAPRQLAHLAGVGGDCLKRSRLSSFDKPTCDVVDP